MRITKTIIIFSIFFIFLTGFNDYLFSWGLFNLFTDKEFSEYGLYKVETFNPDQDILYLPAYDNNDIFASIDNLSICRKKEVRKFIYLYLTTGREYLKRAIENSYIYIDIVNEVFEKNSDIPKDIAYLPLLESAFNPHAVSRSKAVGLWQFVKNTSTPLGLQENRWIDERRDIEKSTTAALRHLRNLNKIFKSWELTLAAYNGGGGYISRAMQKTNTKNIWELIESGELKQETNEYVPKFIALLIIYKNQRLFGIKDELNIPKKCKTEVLALKFPVNIKDVAELSGVSINTIKQYNPELKQNNTPPYQKKYTLRIPSNARKRIIKNSGKLYKKRFTTVKIHKVKKGESISTIARHYKKKRVRLSNLMA